MPDDFGNKPRIFISYSRKDGEDFAADLRKNLIDIFGESALWRDRDEMEGGVAWWNQITEALDNVQFMVLVATPQAMESAIVRKEWRYARQQGVCVYPVQVPNLPIDFAAMPRWMRDSHFYDLDKEWETFVNYLKSPCTARWVAFMAPDLPTHFVDRPKEFDALATLLLDAERDNPVAITTALKGAGGFGKTTLAAALCHDEDVQQAFDDGILWVTLGEKPNLVDALTKLYRALTNENPGFVDVEEGATKLAERLADLDCLIVLDDVWNPAHLKPFLRGGERCARLVTTRLLDVAVDANAKRIDVDEMTSDESVQLLLAGIEPQPDDLTPFAALAERLGEWALLLELVNGALRKHIERGRSIEQALTEVNLDLDEEGFTAFDQRNPEDRNDAVERSLNVSLNLLTDNERTDFLMLAIFPDDTDIPATTIAILWEINQRPAVRQLEVYADLSLLRYDAEHKTFRLHDVVREVLAVRLDDPAAIHRRLIDNYGDLTQLPDAYAWRNIAYHLVQSRQHEKLRNRLLNASYLQNKLNGVGWRLDVSQLGINTVLGADVNSLIADCDYLPDDETIQLVKSALSISAHILTEYPEQCLSQIYGRLLSYRDDYPEIGELVHAIENHKTHPALLTAQPTLQQAGGSLLRTFIGHTDQVTAVAFAPDGTMALSASNDKTLKLWDVATGQDLRTFHGQTKGVNAVAFAPDGTTALSASSDGSLKLWDVATGQEVRTFSGNMNSVKAVAFAPDGQTILSGSVNSIFSKDHTLILWDVHNGEEIHTFSAHTDGVTAVAFAPDGTTALSASKDRALKLWDVATGQELLTFSGHLDWVKAVAFAPDGSTALSVSSDHTLKLWDVHTGQEIRTFSGIADWVNMVAFTPDGTIALSASASGTLVLWDVAAGQAARTVSGHIHKDAVTAVAFAPDGSTALSASWEGTLKLWLLAPSEDRDVATEQQADRTVSGHVHKDAVTTVAFAPDGTTALSASLDGSLKLWDVATGQEVRTFSGKMNSVKAVAFAPDGTTVLSASASGTLVLWDVATGRQILLAFHGHIHRGGVNAVAFAPDGTTALSASDDQTLKLWDVVTGQALRTLSGHENRVMAVGFAPDGQTALSSSWDRTLKLWDVATGDILMDMPDTPTNRAELRRQHSVSLDPILHDQNLMLFKTDGSIEIWHGEVLLLLYTADAPIYGEAYNIAPSLHIGVGDAGGAVHILRPNPALRRMMEGGE